MGVLQFTWISGGTRRGGRWMQGVHSQLMLDLFLIFVFCCSLSFRLNVSTHLPWNQHPEFAWSTRLWVFCAGSGTLYIVQYIRHVNCHFSHLQFFAKVNAFKGFLLLLLNESILEQIMGLKFLDVTLPMLLKDRNIPG